MCLFCGLSSLISKSGQEIDHKSTTVKVLEDRRTVKSSRKNEHHNQNRSSVVRLLGYLVVDVMIVSSNEVSGKERSQFASSAYLLSGVDDFLIDLTVRRERVKQSMHLFRDYRCYQYLLYVLRRSQKCWKGLGLEMQLLY